MFWWNEPMFESVLLCAILTHRLICESRLWFVGKWLENNPQQSSEPWHRGRAQQPSLGVLPDRKPAALQRGVKSLLKIKTLQSKWQKSTAWSSYVMARASGTRWTFSAAGTTWDSARKVSKPHLQCGGKSLECHRESLKAKKGFGLDNRVQKEAK